MKEPFNIIKDNISFRLVNPDQTSYDISELPHTDFLDLTYIYYMTMKMDDAGVDTIMIDNRAAAQLGLTADDLHKIAKENFSSLFPLELFGTVGDNFAMITTKYKLFGAAYMSDNALLGGFADSFGGDVYVIPSSQHEVIICPADIIPREDMDATIRTVNREAVEEKDYLSDHVYLFSSRDREIQYFKDGKWIGDKEVREMAVKEKGAAKADPVKASRNKTKEDINDR